MILIADGGSTKGDWVLLNKDGKLVNRTQTIGLNPLFVSSEIVYNELSKNALFQKYKDVVSEIYFYGASCSSPENNEIIEIGIRKLFQKSKVIVGSDLLAAAYAVYSGKPNLVCILGTGSNVCFFDGKSLKKETPSLSYILGDEGSASHIGKRLLQSYFLKKMPTHLALKFEKEFDLDVDTVKRKVYSRPFANTYLASFSEFLTNHKDDLFTKNLLHVSFKKFFFNQVLPFKEAKEVEINFVGSIAFFYSDILKEVTKEFNLTVSKIIQKPLDKHFFANFAKWFLQRSRL